MLLEIDWNQFLVGDDNTSFLLEIGLRTISMYFIIVIGLKLMGKRGIKQLSVFELVVIIGLGSAAGDPMFYKEIGMMVPLIVFAIVIGAYRLTTYLMGKSDRFESLVEGKPTCLIRDGEFSISNFKKENMAKDEFFAEMRQKSVSHLGQIETAIIETSGNLSIFFYEDEKVKYGLPILPDLFKKSLTIIPEPGKYACTFCGNIEDLYISENQHCCDKCGKDVWVKAINIQRVR